MAAANIFVVSILSNLISRGLPIGGNDLIRNQDQIPIPPELLEMTYTPPPVIKVCPMYQPYCDAVSGTKNSICFCDAMCSLRDDCCQDYRPYKREDHLSRTRILAYMQCSEPNMLGIPEQVSILRRCPHEYGNAMVRAQCEFPEESDKMLMWPVSGRYNGLMYRNIYCAMCWAETKPLFWTFKSQCRGSVKALSGATPKPDPNFQHFLRACEHTFVSPFHGNEAANERDCDVVYISTCPRAASKEDAVRCARGKTEIVETFSKVLDDIVRYKNQDCAFCNGVAYDDILCIPDVLQQGVPGFETTFNRGQVGLSVLFDLNSKKVRKDGLWHSGFEGMNMNCPQDQIYDIFMEECRTLVCNDNEIYHNKACHPDNSTFMPDCPTILVPARDFVQLENDRIHLKGTNTYLNASQYHRFNDSVLICAESIVYDEISVYKLSGIITTIGSAISCASLLLLLIVYSIIPKLRNVPGKLTMGLAFSLFWAQLLFLIGIGRDEIFVICAAFAVLIHYFYLSAFAWMFLLSLDLTRTFRPGNTRSIVRRSSNRRFVKYALYAFLMPAFLVILSIALDFIPNTDPYNPAYGIRQCWFSNRNSLLILFLLPVSIHVISNLLMFVYTVYNVCKATRDVQMVRPVDECRIFLYLKLSVIMGTTWVLVYAWLLTHEYALQVLFDIFNSLQGLFICLCFVCRPKTYSLVRSRVTGKEVSQDTTPSTKRTSLPVSDKSASLLRGGRKSKQDLWIEMHGDPLTTAPLNGDKRATVF